jgi:galactose-1-phosphate uridylyltransferase
MPHRLTKRSPLPRLAVFAIALAGLLALTAPAHAQGCALCRDNTAATPPRTQMAYRHAIELLATTACSLFAGTIFLLKRQP